MTRFMAMTVALVLCWGCNNDNGESVSNFEESISACENVYSWGDFPNAFASCRQLMDRMVNGGQEDVLPCELPQGGVAYFCEKQDDGTINLFESNGKPVGAMRYSPEEVAGRVFYVGERPVEESKTWTLDPEKGIDFWYDYEKDELVPMEHAPKNASFVGFAGFRSGRVPTSYQVHGNESYIFVTLEWPERKVKVQIDNLAHHPWCHGFTRVREEGFATMVHYGACGSASWRNTWGLIDGFNGF